MTWFSAFCVGIAQGISIIPGISRSGMTIATSLFLGIERNEAMRFSFLLSIPAVIGAMALETYDTSLQNIQWVPVIGGIFTSATVGYLSLIVLADVMMKGKVHYFSIYCFLVGVFAIIVSFLN